MRLKLVYCCAAFACLAGAAGALPKRDDICEWVTPVNPAPNVKPTYFCIKPDLHVLMRPDPVAADPSTKSAADAGDPRAMLLVGNNAFFTGDGAAGLKWIQKSADAKYPDAMTELAALYARGVVVQLDYAQALGLYHGAADLGSAASMTGIARMYASGDGVAKDDAEATRWFVKAADSGDVASMMTAGVRYRNGIGAPKNGPEAVRWLTLAYQNGLTAQPSAILGDIYDKGDGVPANAALAFHWCRLAAENGDPSAAVKIAAGGLLGSTSPVARSAGHGPAARAEARCRRTLSIDRRA